MDDYTVRLDLNEVLWEIMIEMKSCVEKQINISVNIIGNYHGIRLLV